MSNETSIIEIDAPALSADLAEDYRLARQLALIGSHEEARCIYSRVLAETSSETLQALVYNDLAPLALAAGDTQLGRSLLEQVPIPTSDA